MNMCIHNLHLRKAWVIRPTFNQRPKEFSATDNHVFREEEIMHPIPSLLALAHQEWSQLGILFITNVDSLWIRYSIFILLSKRREWLFQTKKSLKIRSENCRSLFIAVFKLLDWVEEDFVSRGCEPFLVGCKVTQINLRNNILDQLVVNSFQI